MDSASQMKALAALEPFVVLATTTKSPSHRFLADLITRATSAQGTYIFTELLQTPAISSLRSSSTPPEFAVYFTLLEIFSWGTYAEYKSTPNLPALTDAQATKLRQLSLLSLAASATPLTYSNLLAELSLSSAHDLETLVTQSIYSSLLTARLSPTSDPPLIHISSVAPLRDLRPLSLPQYMTVLSVWEARCTTVLASLEANINAIRNEATTRKHIAKKRQDIVDHAVMTKAEQEEGAKAATSGMSFRGKGKGPGNKRDLDAHMGFENDEDEFEDASEEGGNSGGMDIDDGNIQAPPAVGAGGVGMGRSSKKRGSRGR